MAELKEPKIEILISPVCDVLAGLATIGQIGFNQHQLAEECAAEEKEAVDRIATFINTTLATLRSRLRNNLEAFFSSECYPGVGLLSLVSNPEFASSVPAFLGKLTELPVTDLATALLSFGKIYRGNLQLKRPIEDLLANRQLLIEHIEQNMTVPTSKIEGLADIVQKTVESGENLAELIEHFWYVIMAQEREQRLQIQQLVAEQLQARIQERGGVRFATELTNLRPGSSFDTYSRIILAPCSFYEYGMIATESKDESCLILIIGHNYHILRPEPSKSEGPEPIEQELLSQVYAALSDTTRLQIVRLLHERPYYGQELAKLLTVSNATIFHHLSLLNKIGIVHLERIEHRVYYALNSEKLKQFLEQGIQFLLN
jgi:DNA-binding transcriptional ArsR family regulator